MSPNDVVERLIDLNGLYDLNDSNHQPNQRGSEFIDGVALEEYADEQDDYAQEREIEACIKAVDVDCDGKIGQSLSQPARQLWRRETCMGTTAWQFSSRYDIILYCRLSSSIRALCECWSGTPDARCSLYKMDLV